MSKESQEAGEKQEALNIFLGLLALLGLADGIAVIGLQHSMQPDFYAPDGINGNQHDTIVFMSWVVGAISAIITSLSLITLKIWLSIRHDQASGATKPVFDEDSELLETYKPTSYGAMTEDHPDADAEDADSVDTQEENYHCC